MFDVHYIRVRHGKSQSEQFWELIEKKWLLLEIRPTETPKTISAINVNVKREMKNSGGGEKVKQFHGCPVARWLLV